MNAKTRPPFKSLYDSLGVPADATTAEIHLAYADKKSALEELIRAGNPGAAAELIMWSEAHKTLSDFTERRRYDMMLADRKAQSERLSGAPSLNPSRASASIRAAQFRGGNVETEPEWYESKKVFLIAGLIFAFVITAWVMDSRSKAATAKYERELAVQQEKTKLAEDERQELIRQESARASSLSQAEMEQRQARMAEQRLRNEASQTSRDMDRQNNWAQAREDSLARTAQNQRTYQEQVDRIQNRQTEDTERRRANERLEKDRRELINILNADGRHHEAQKISRTRAEELRTQECARLNSRC